MSSCFRCARRGRLGGWAAGRLGAVNHGSLLVLLFKFTYVFYLLVMLSYLPTYLTCLLCYLRLQVTYTFCYDFITLLIKDALTADFGRTEILVEGLTRVGAFRLENNIYKCIVNVHNNRCYCVKNIIEIGRKINAQACDNYVNLNSCSMHLAYFSKCLHC